MPADYPFLNSIHTGDTTVSGLNTGYEGTTRYTVRPENWRQGILFQDINGDMPLTGILSQMSGSKTDDPVFHWFTETLPNQRANIAGVYTEGTLTTAYTSGGAAGDILYVKLNTGENSETAANQTKQFRPGHQVLLRCSTDYDVDKNAVVTSVSANGASSYIAVELLETDTATDRSHDISDADTILIIGNVNAEGGTMPGSIVYVPTEVSNQVQIFRNTLSITRTALATRLRTEEARKKARRDVYRLHGMEMEKSLIFGKKSTRVGDNGHPVRSSDGIISFIRQHASDNIFDYANDSDTDFNSKAWTVAGADWLNEKLEVLFCYGASRKMAVCGNGALLGLQKLIMSMSNTRYEISSTQRAFGINYRTWITPFGEIYLTTHKLFSHETTSRNSMLIIDPKNFDWRYITDTKPIVRKELDNEEGVDGIEEEWLTEGGYEIHHPNEFGMLNGVGLDNAIAA